MAPRGSRDDFWRGADQPARRAFGIDEVESAGTTLRVVQRDLYRKAFCVLTHFAREGPAPARKLLLIPPLSGHFPFLFRDLILALLPDHDVAVLEWVNARHVQAAEGPFTLDSDIAETIEAIRYLDGDVHVVGICQGAVSAFAAAAIMAQTGDVPPCSLVLIAAPVDPTANPTDVVRLIRARRLDWFERYALADVPARYPGAGRRVYPAQYQLGALMTYLSRHLLQNGVLVEKLRRDDGADPARFPFLDAFTSVMDLPAAWFLDNARIVFHERALARNALVWGGQPVDLAAMDHTALMTVEAEYDDIAAPGQGAAAHGLCPHLPAARHERYVLPGGGHFNTFHGDTVRREIAPRITAFTARA
ncbi:polyhydroxyalkanoate depolymerase [Dichotomicrobium thermohalophilum]|uniref:Poly(3-hydroxybutyrate) depolymerase n=1 Tax=Dichotomicrobium thermohalophilum TaxID=933063 RepID=A0A397PE68_9HYPH|nr:polyhydroxyalkanoate depolymerase [Dichotomicrobium thermohalophilum]RIA47790.1 poly(3-hydroxybutyrate) depolymerase [Dichotomicrobium thermohalophilum]